MRVKKWFANAFISLRVILTSNALTKLVSFIICDWCTANDEFSDTQLNSSCLNIYRQSNGHAVPVVDVQHVPAVEHIIGASSVYCVDTGS